MPQKKKKMMLTILGFALILAAIGVFFWYRAALWHACNPPLPREMISVGSAKFDVEMATTMIEQSCGLSGRAGLAAGQGMIFLFGSGSTQNFWMKDMNFALDIVWISDDKVVGFAQNVPPPAPGTPLWSLTIYTSPPDVDTVLEVPAGTVTKDNIHMGDAVAVL